MFHLIIYVDVPWHDDLNAFPYHFPKSSYFNQGVVTHLKPPECRREASLIMLEKSLNLDSCMSVIKILSFIFSSFQTAVPTTRRYYRWFYYLLNESLLCFGRCPSGNGWSLGLPLVEWIGTQPICVEWSRARRGWVKTKADPRQAQGPSAFVSCIHIYVYAVYIYFLFPSPPPPTQAADFDMCFIVWSWICHLCLHLLCRLLFEVSLVASSSWLHHHPICHLDVAHCC